MSNKKILVIEDDKNLQKLIQYNLDKADFKSVVAKSAEEALDILKKQSVDLILLDIMLPGMDGFAACRLIKQDNSLKYIPVIMLTARGEEVDKIVGLELGADDYVVKPFSPRELILRIKAVLKRNKQEEPGNIIRMNNIVMDLSKHKVTANNKEIELTPLEFKLLATLLKKQGHVYSRENLLNEVWSMDADVYTRTIDTHIKSLRKKLGQTGDSIETIRGLGYKFKDKI
ncbi:MAG: response regulator [bacterium]|nr:response regulator [bacterium]